MSTIVFAVVAALALDAVALLAACSAGYAGAMKKRDAVDAKAIRNIANALRDVTPSECGAG